MKRGASTWMGWLALCGGLSVLVFWPLCSVLLRVATVQNGPQAPSLDRSTRLGPLALETLRLVGWTEWFALPLGIALALLTTRTDIVGRTWARGLILLGLFVPLPLQAVCWLGAFGNQGRSQAIGSAPWIVGVVGAAWVHAAAALPWVVLIVGAGLRTVEPELEELALQHMPAWRVTLAITLRRALGAMVAAAVAVGVLTATDMTVTDLIPLRTFAEAAYTLAQQGITLEAVIWRATAPPFLILAVLVTVVGLSILKLDPARLALATTPPRLWRLGRFRGPLSVAVWLVVALLVALPIYGLIWRAGRVGPGLVTGAGSPWTVAGFSGTMRAAWSDMTAQRVGSSGVLLWDSLVWAALGAGFASVLAWGLAWWSRQARAGLLLPLVVVVLGLSTPAPVLGLVMKMAYIRLRWLTETPGLLVLTYAARSLPYAVLMLWPFVRALPQAWSEQVALKAGGPLRQFWEAGLRPGWPALGAAWLLTTALSFGELPAAYFVYAPGYEPIAISIWSLLHVGVESRLAGIGLWMIVIVGVIGLLAALIVAAMGQRGGAVKLNGVSEP